MKRTMTFEEVTANTISWSYASATGKTKQGINAQVDGMFRWYEEYKKGKYRLVYERPLNSFDGMAARTFLEQQEANDGT